MLKTNLCKGRNYRGFSLMELLIVVVIIAILAAVAIPVFTNQVSSTKLATDAANLSTAETLAVSDMMVNHRDTVTNATASLQATPDAEISNQTIANAAKYYFNTAGENGLSVALSNGALATTGDFRSVSDDSLTIVVFVNDAGEVLAAGWETVAAGNNNP